LRQLTSGSTQWIADAENTARVVRVRQRRVLEACADELHIASVLQLITRPRDQLVTGFDRGHPQPPGEQGSRQLTCAAADLKHRGAWPDTGHLTAPID